MWWLSAFPGFWFPEMGEGETWRMLYLLLLGQLLSFSLAVHSFASSLIAELGVDTPLTQSFFAYFFLAAVYGSVFLYRRQKLLVPWYWYIVLGIVDVQANYLVVKAYPYSSITSVTLLDCWTIPWVIALTWFVLGTRYSLWQFLGAAVCVAGLGLVLLSDSWDSNRGGTKPLLGDVLVIAGTLCFAFSNVAEIGLFAGFAISSFLFYTIAPLVLKMSGSTLFNLSLLTSDMWAVVIRIFFYRQKVDWLYYVAFCAVALGLIIYSLNDTSSANKTSVEDEGHHESEPLIEENLSATHESINQ